VTESWADAARRIGHYFDDHLSRHGQAPAALDYGSWASQQARFEVIASALNVAGKRVLDVGCGLAHLQAFLAGRFGAFSYTGVDLSAGMVEAARRRQPSLDVRLLDILADDPGGPYDLVVANGIFYLLGDDAPGRMQRLVSRLYHLSAKAVAFTSLSTWVDSMAPGEFHADPAATLAFCRTLTPRVVLRHDYLPHDFAVFLYRP